jgi:hypothetical protein
VSQLEQWTVRFASAQALKEWEAVTAAEPELMERLLLRLKDRPLDRSDNPRRIGQLHGGLATRRVAGRALPQWQYEITSSGRLWYCPDKDDRVIWVTKARLDHPRETE